MLSLPPTGNESPGNESRGDIYYVYILPSPTLVSSELISVMRETGNFGNQPQNLKTAPIREVDNKPKAHPFTIPTMSTTALAEPTPITRKPTAKDARRKLAALRDQVSSLQFQLRAARGEIAELERKAFKRQKAVDEILIPGGVRPSTQFRDFTVLTETQSEALWAEMLSMPKPCHYEFYQAYIAGKAVMVD